MSGFGLSPRPAEESIPDLRAHLPALDGVRGLAIVMVLLAHFTGYGGMHPTVFVDRGYYIVAMLGGCGVDLFFVLSGFLITGILLDTKEDARFFRNFYTRRVLRIFPLYYGFLALTFLLLPRLSAPTPAYASLIADQSWYWCYLSNVRIALAGWPPFHLIGHFWSLAVEEQFYLLWPLLVFFLPRRGILAACGAFIVGSLGVRIALTLAGYDPVVNVITPARMDALALGATLAVLARDPGGIARLAKWARPAFAVSGAILAIQIVWSRGWMPHEIFYRTVGRSLLALFFGALLVMAMTAVKRSPMDRFFGGRLMGFFGVYSYGIYVFHHPLIVLMERAGFSVRLAPELFGSQLPGHLMVLFTGTAGSVLIAVASYHLWELPFLKLKRFFPRGEKTATAIPVFGAESQVQIPAHVMALPHQAPAPAFAEQSSVAVPMRATGFQDPAPVHARAQVPEHVQAQVSSGASVPPPVFAEEPLGAVSKRSRRASLPGTGRREESLSLGPAHARAGEEDAAEAPDPDETARARALVGRRMARVLTSTLR